MNPVTMPYHLFIPTLICFLSLILIATKWKFIFRESKRKNIWIALVIFLIIYLIIVGNAMFTDIYCQWDVNKYDLNMNGIFENNEINSEQKAAYQRLINDTGRNFSVITGLIFSGLISFISYLIGLGIEKHNRLKNE